MRSSIASLVVGLLVVGGIAVTTWSSPAAAEDGSIGLRLVDGPSDDQGGLATDRISHVLAAGETAEWTVEVTNTGSEPMEVPLNAEAVKLVDGQFHPADEDEQAELPDWITVSPQRPEVPAGGTARASVVIDVPGDATDGDHAAAVWASASSEGQISQVNRIGLRTLITVADGVPAAGLAVEGIDVERAPDGEEVVAVEVGNTGGRMLEVAGELELLDGPGGVNAGEMPLAPTTIAAGDSERLRADVSRDLPAGEWTADVEVIADGLSEQASEMVILGRETETGDEGDQAGVTALAMVLLLLSIIALLAARRRDNEAADDLPTA